MAAKAGWMFEDADTPSENTRDLYYPEPLPEWNRKREVKREVKEVTVAEIHEEFDTAVDRLVEQANAILEQEVKKEAETYLKLEEFGFNSAKSVLEVKKDQTVRRKSAEVLQYVKKYQTKYPQYKFIDKEEMTRIRRKYGLVQGKPANFIGAIPAENARDIIALDIDVYDRRIWYRLFEGETEWGRASFSEQYMTMAEIIKRADKIDRFASGFIGAKKFFKIGKPNIEIIATYDQMNIGTREFVNSEGMIEYKVVDPDPIVITPVIGGWLIVTKWGAEAEIEEVQ